MTLQSSGQISLLDIQNEFGGSSPIGINEYYGSGGAPASGTISIGDFYGRSSFSGWSSYMLGSYTNNNAFTGVDYYNGPNVTPGSGGSPVTFNIAMANASGSSGANSLQLYVGGNLQQEWYTSNGYYTYSHTSYFGSSYLQFRSIIADFSTYQEDNYNVVNVGATPVFYHFYDGVY